MPPPGLLPALSLQLRRFRSLAPPRLPTRPRPGPALGPRKPTRPRRPRPKSSAPPPVRRWQCANIGELWQLDASPHRWFPHSKQLFPMLNLLDDCSRLFTGSKIYERELLLAYFDFLPAAFLPTDARSGFTSTTTASFSPTTPTRSPRWAGRCGSTTSACATPPRPRPRARSNANTSSGRAGCLPTSPVKRSPRWPSPPPHHRPAHAAQHP